MGDWVNVRLSEFGERYLKETGGGSLAVHEGSGFVFKPGESVRVTRAFDWARVLQTQHINGHALFEVVPDQAAEVHTNEEEK